jgi:glutamine synthetase
VLALLLVVSLLSICPYPVIILSKLIHAHTGGSAAHTHISVHPINPDQPFGLQSPAGDDAQAATSENVLTPLERIFLAGLLDHLPAACAFTLPIRASYARMLDGIWSGGTWVAWGRDNRETPVRLCVPPTRVPIPAPARAQPAPAKPATPAPNPPSGNHFEVKCVDGTSSPYLALSGLLGAGVLGIQSQSPLIEKDCRAPAATMTEAEREAVGVKRRLPRTWEEARGALEGDVAMRGLLGGVVQGFLAVGEVSHSFAALQSIVCANADLVDRPWMGFYTPLRTRRGEYRCSSKIIDLELRL